MGKGTNQIATRQDCNDIFYTWSSDLTKCVTYKEVNESENLTTGKQSIVTTASTLLASGTTGNVTSVTSGTSTLSTASINGEMTLSIPYMSISTSVTLKSPLALASAVSGRVNVFIYLYLNGTQIASGQGNTRVSFSAGFKGTRATSVTATINSRDYYVSSNSQNLTAKMIVTTNVCYIKSASATISAKTFEVTNKTSKLVKYSNIKPTQYSYGVCCATTNNTSTNLKNAFGSYNPSGRYFSVTGYVSTDSSFTSGSTNTVYNYLNANATPAACVSPKTYYSEYGVAPILYYKLEVYCPQFYELNAMCSKVTYRINYSIKSNDGTLNTNSYAPSQQSISGSTTSGNSYWSGSGGDGGTLSISSGWFQPKTQDDGIVSFNAYISNVSRISASGGGGASSSSRIGVWE